MTKPISRKMHGLLTDYPYAALVSTAPETVGFKDEETAATLCRALAGGILLTSLMTRAEWGAVSVISYKTAIVTEIKPAAGGARFPLFPTKRISRSTWRAGFSRRARRFCSVSPTTNGRATRF